MHLIKYIQVMTNMNHDLWHDLTLYILHDILSISLHLQCIWLIWSTTLSAYTDLTHKISEC